MWVLLILAISVVHGFLIDTQKPGIGQTGTADQYLTVSEFYDEKKLLQQETERNLQNSVQLRHDMDKSLAVLTSQLKLRFDALERSLQEDGKLNETKQDLILLEQKYTALEQNNIAILTSFEQLKRENSLLQDKYNSVDKELIVLQNKTRAYEELAKNIDSHCHVNTAKLEMLKNTTDQLSKNMTDLKHLQNIRPLVDISSLQKAVQSLTTTTHSLSMKEQARSQDFLALYNITIDSRKTSTDIETNINRRFFELMSNQSHAFSAFESSNNMKLSSIEVMVDDMKKYENESLTLLQQQIDVNSEQVVLLASNEQNGVISGIMKFNSVKFNVGFNNISIFFNNGKLAIEKSGLYIISVSVISLTNNAEFMIYLNGNMLSRNRFSAGSWMSGAHVVALKLHAGDKIWVQTISITVSSGLYNTFSIIKVK